MYLVIKFNSSCIHSVVIEIISFKAHSYPYECSNSAIQLALWLANIICSFSITMKLLTFVDILCYLYLWSLANSLYLIKIQLHKL